MSRPNYTWQEHILKGSDEDLLKQIEEKRLILEKMEADASAGRWRKNHYLASSAGALPGWYYLKFSAEAERRGLEFRRYAGPDVPGHSEWETRYWSKRREEF